jgi:hypothetical protein
LLTPGLAVGGLLGSLLFMLVGPLFPGSDMESFALLALPGSWPPHANARHHHRLSDGVHANGPQFPGACRTLNRRCIHDTSALERWQKSDFSTKTKPKLNEMVIKIPFN